ncbi:MAG: hypothetical protein K2X87_03305, partial [Gemmataceae bacterium]|nr:hypothetical protein [Gemmataceae bacterium]
MKRSLCGLAVLGLAAVPDWAAAFDPCWVPPPPCGYGYWYAVPVYLVPVHPALPPAVAVAPVRQAPLAPPRITPVEQPATATPKPAPPRIEPAPIPPAFAAPTAAPPPDSVRPAGG